MSEAARTLADCDEVGPFGAETASALRLFVNRNIFRFSIFLYGFLVTLVHFFNRDLAWRVAQAASRRIGVHTGVAVEIIGLEYLPDEPAIITPNHASHFDIVAIIGHLPGQNRFATKKELFREPILGMVMKRLGMVPIDRENPASSIERLNRLEAQGEEAFSLVIFPEGTRSPAGGGLQAFKKGAFTLAIQMGRPILPVVIYGSDQVMPRGKYLSIHPGRIVLEILPAISTVGLAYEDREGLRDRVRDLLSEKLKRAHPE